MKELGKYRSFILILVDAILINIAYVLAIYFRYEYGIFLQLVKDYEKIAIVFIAIYLISFYFFKLYESIWNYASIDEFLLVIGACITGNVISTILAVLFRMDFSYAVSILSGILVILFIVGFRVSFRIYSRLTNILDVKSNVSDLKRTLIIGAGEAAILVIKEMKNNKNSKYNPIALIDDDKYKVGKSILGIKIEGTRKDIIKVCKEKEIETIIIAAPSMNEEDKKEILDKCKKTECKIQMVPSIYSVIDGKVSLNQIKDVEIEDLLG